MTCRVVHGVELEDVHGDGTWSGVIHGADVSFVKRIGFNQYVPFWLTYQGEFRRIEEVGPSALRTCVSNVLKCRPKAQRDG